ncbi:MAG: DUF1826 domain-containing protein, partial [Pseudomonadota bacterium]
MNAPATLKRPRAVGVASVATLEDLSAIREPGCAAAIWDRDLPAHMTGWLAALAPDEMPKGRATLRPAQTRDTVEALLDQAGAPAGPGRELFADDVAAMAVGFAAVCGAPYLRMRLQAVTGNACRKFHLDVVEQRL